MYVIESFQILFTEHLSRFIYLFLVGCMSYSAPL